MPDQLSYFRKLRIITFLMIALLVFTTVVMIIIYPENRGKSGVLSWVITIGLLFFYLFFCTYLPYFGSTKNLGGAIRIGTRFGIISGMIWILHISMVRFIPIPRDYSPAITFIFMVLVLLIYGYSSFSYMNMTGHFFGSVLAAVWAAMFSVLILFIWSWIITLLFMPMIEQVMIVDPDYLITGMINISDYTVHHNIESAGIHLLEAPLLALFVSFAGIFIFGLRRKVMHH